MAIKGLEDITYGELFEELDKGARFITYQYSISCIIMTFKRSSDVYFVREGEHNIGPCLLYTLISLVLGWWGFPWGPIYTIGAVGHNLCGGVDVTNEVVNHIKSRIRTQEYLNNTAQDSEE